MTSMRVIEPIALVAQRADDFERGGDACDAVEAAAGRHGVAVRADRDNPERGIGAIEPADQIAGGVDAHGEAGLGEALGEQRHGLRETAG